MAKQNGDQFLLKIDINGKNNFKTVAGLRSTGFSAKLDPIDITSKDSEGFRELLSGAGIQSFTLTGAGVFDSGEAHNTVRQLFFQRSIRNWQIIRGDGSIFLAPCLITNLEYAAAYNSEETFKLTLESAGTVTFSDAA